MGSNTKTMVATVILQLVAEHRLALTDPVAKWLPGLVPNGRAITVRMLLNHTSGLFNYRDDPAVLKAFTGHDARPGRRRSCLLPPSATTRCSRPARATPTATPTTSHSASSPKR